MTINITEVTNIAAEYDLPFYLVRAIITTESNDDIYAYRVEPPYRYLVNVDSQRPFRPLTAEENRSERAPHDFPYFRHISSRDTEWLGQQASWGPMQIMGAVAREYGFKGAFPQLCSIEDGVRYGCMHLATLRDRFLEKHNWEGVIASYNAGSPRYVNGSAELVNQSYVDTVLRHSQQYM